MRTAKQPVRAAIYTRISLDKSGERLGVQRQLDDCAALADRLGWSVIERFDDNDLSAYSGRTRPGFEALLDSLKRGEIDALICWHPDRLYRSLKDLVRLLDVAEAVEIRTVNGGDLDLSTATGKMLATILGSVSFQESAHKAERQRSAAAQRAANGKPQWKRAFGYVAGENGPEIDPEIQPLVEQAYAAVLAGSSLSDICRLWNDAGALTQRWVRPKDSKGNPIASAEPVLERRPWTAPQVSNFLRKPRNAGLRDYQGEIVGKGQWPALVDEDQWHQVQGVLDAPGRAPGRKTVRKHLLTGVLKCGKPGCGGYLSGQWVMQSKGGGAKAHSITYACKGCRGCSVRAEHVEPLVYRAIAGRLAMADAADLLKAEHHDEAETQKLRAERMTLLARLDEIADERADGLLTGQQAQRATARISDKLAEIDQREQSQERRRVLDGIPLGTEKVAEAVEALSPDRLRAVIDLLAEFTVQPVGKGHRVGGARFDPDRVQVAWRR
ncbi:serine recombinase [Mycolicibacterium litorale]|uniref:Serine recombinase n=1 Tax=Mycolicibacterium litorale TaxID=758802 RepID=A0A6S6P1I7_9MYCO|nr:recombinase family protein [Mycolicibacterium litorale]BCI53703.1 serine recombinase [Mycolicibacterium litorale]